MGNEHGEGAGTGAQTALGRSVDYSRAYAPDLLFPMPRLDSRKGLGFSGQLPFTGADIWNAWEVSWLDAQGKPAIAWGEFRVPATTPNIIESKSLKLYLNSLNQERLGAVDTVAALISRDLSHAAGGDVQVRLLAPAQWPREAVHPEGRCLDDTPVAISHYHPQPGLLRVDRGNTVEEALYSHLLRSLCPVTGQPDWGAVSISYRGPAINRAGLLAYIISFREHQDFHEQCVERMFRDISMYCETEFLTVHARYLRRGGLDINPFRTNARGVEGRGGRWFLQ